VTSSRDSDSQSRLTSSLHLQMTPSCSTLFIIIVIIIIILFANNTTVSLCTSTSLQLRRAGQQGPTRTLTAALTRVIKQLLDIIVIVGLRLEIKIIGHAGWAKLNETT